MSSGQSERNADSAHIAGTSSARHALEVYPCAVQGAKMRPMEIGLPKIQLPKGSGSAL